MSAFAQTVTLSNGVKMPRMGFGTYPLYKDALTTAVCNAYEAGFRMFDTSDNYYNEEDLGNSLSEVYTQYGVKREGLFLITKLSDELYPVGVPGAGANRGIYFWKNSPMMQAPTAVHDVIMRKVEHSLKALRTDYIDLLLMHRPYPDFFSEIWKEMICIYRQGIVKAIGVCSCYERHLEKLSLNSDVYPMVNQIELSPLNTKEELVEYSNKNNIATMVYSPLMTLRVENVQYQNLLSELAQKYGCSKARILLRFYLQLGLVPIPKSAKLDRCRDNISAMDFALDDIDVARLLSCNCDYQTLPESKGCPGF